MKLSLLVLTVILLTRTGSVFALDPLSLTASTDATTTQAAYDTAVDDIRPLEVTSWSIGLDIREDAGSGVCNGGNTILVRATSDARSGCEMYGSNPTATFGSRVTGPAAVTSVKNLAGRGEWAEAIEWDLGLCNINNGNNAQEKITLTFDYTLPNDPEIYSSNLKEPDPNIGQPWEACIITVTVYQNGAEVTALTDTIKYEIVDTQLEVQKYLDGNNTYVDGGDILLFSVDIKHTDSADGDANEDSLIGVEDLTIIDTLSTYITLIPGSVTVTPASSETIVKGNGGTDTTIEVSIPTLATGSEVRISYQATLSNLAPSATKIINTAEVTATRSGYGNTIYAKNNTATVTTATKEAEIRVNGTALTETDILLFDVNATDLAIGEVASIEVRLLLPEGISEDNRFQLYFGTSPGLLAYLDYDVQLTPNLVTTGQENVTLTDTNSDGYIDLVEFDFGTITNNADNALNENDVYKIVVKAYAPDVAANVNGAQVSLQVTVVLAESDQICYEVNYNNGLATKILFPLKTPLETARDFYDYYGSRAHTGNEDHEKALIYFVYDNTNQTAFVLVYDKEGAADGGFAFLKVESDGLAGFLDKDGLPVRVLLEDDGGPNDVYCPMEKNDFIRDSGWNGNDAYCWDDTTGTGYFNHKWSSSYTDGMVLGYLPNQNWCFRMDWEDYFRPDGAGGWQADRPRLEGIDEIALMSEDANGEFQKTFFSTGEAYGLEVCGYTCNLEKGQLASRTTTLKFDILKAQLALTTGANVTSGDANDAILHTVSVRHPTPGCVTHATDATASCAPVYNVTITTDFDNVGPLVSGTVNVILTGSSEYTIGVKNDSQITVFFPVFPQTEVFVLTFESLIKQSVEPTEIVETRAHVIGYSAPNTTYSMVVIDETKTEEFAVLAPALVSLTVDSTSFAGSGTSAHNTTNEDLAVGEVATLSVNVLLPEATTNISVVVEMPRINGKMEVIDSKLARVGSSINYDTVGQPLNAPGQHLDLDGDGILDAVRFPLGVTVNTADNVITGSDEMDFEVTVRVLDDLLNSDGKSLPMKATLYYSSKSVTSATYVDMVGPTITVVKTANLGPVDYGQTFTYSLAVSVTGTTSAYSVDLTDTVPDMFSVTGTSTTKGTSSNTGNLVTADLGTMTVPSTETITITATVTPASQAVSQGTEITNAASVVYLVLPAEPYANRTATGVHNMTITHICGNGATGDPEACDDGNTVGGDGCAADCTVESGYVCNTTIIPAVCALCGDSVIAPGIETCDDGATISGDGCDSACQTEFGWVCTGSPSVCTTTCGDGLVAAGVEECDDGNTLSQDCCSSTCTIEPTMCVCAPGSPSVCRSEFKCWTTLDHHPECCSIPNVLGTCPDRLAQAPQE